MKTTLALAVLLAPAAVSAQSLEALRAGSAAAFLGAPAALRAAADQEPSEPFLQPAPVPVPAGPARGQGVPLATVALDAAQDRNLRLMPERLGARDLDVGAATDAGFKNFYLSFSDAKTTTLAPLGDLKRLRGPGVDARVDASTVYNFRVSINIFNPVRGSTLHMTPAQGTQGPSHDMSTGSVLDAARAHASVFSANGSEYWLFYGRDAAAGGGGFAPTRSFLFVHMDGLSSKAWPLAESALTPGSSSTVDLGGTRVTLSLTADRRLLVSSAD